MKPLIPFTRAQWTIIIGFLAKMTESRPLYFQFNQQMNGTRTDERTYIRRKIDELVNVANPDLKWEYIYLLMIAMKGNSDPKWTSPLFEMFDFANFTTLHSYVKSPSSLKKFIHELLELNEQIRFLDPVTVGQIKRFRDEHILVFSRRVDDLFQLLK